MRERVELLVGRATRAMWVMTFHAACARMLRADADKLGYTRQFTIYDAADQRRLIKKCLDELGYDTKRFTPRAMQSQISDAKNRLRTPEDFSELVGSSFEQTVADVYRLYERELHRSNAMDFDDLLVRSVQLLERFQEVHDRYAKSFRWVMVDEYQDTNHVQYRWLQLLTSEHRNLAVVGDDAQSIYGFRGADIRNILDFEDDYPDAHVVKLEQNYRSTQTILGAANAVIAHNRGQMVKHLWTDVGEGDPVRVREMADEHAEARWVTAEIERLVDEGVRRSEIAVFYRTNAQSRVLEDMLVRAQVGYQIIGGTKFYERAEIKDAVQYLQFLVNPQDGTAFTRIANSPRRGIGQTSLSRVLGYANDVGLTVWDAAAGEVPGLAKPRAQGARALHGDDGAPEGARRTRTRRSRSCSTSCSTETGYKEALEAERTIEAQGRLENLEELVRVAREYDTNAPDGGNLGEFLQQIALLADADGIRDDEGLVTLDDDAQREGPRVPDRVHDRHGGRRLPAPALDRGEQRRGGAPARLRRPHPRDARPHADLRAPPRVLRRRRDAGGQVALPGRDPARADRPAGADLTRPAGDRPRRELGRRRGRQRRGHRRRRRPCSASARTSCTPSSARAWSPASSQAGSSSCASRASRPTAS